MMKEVMMVPYDTKKDLPGPVQDNLPSHAQDIYKEAYNNAWDEYADPADRRGDAGQEEVAHKVAWAAVKRKYEKGSDGEWHER